MAILLSQTDVLRQSKAVYAQFGGTKWIPFAKENVKTPHKDTKELLNVGMGKVLLLAAMGESLEGHIDIIKKYRDRVDIVTCDKGFGFLVERGIKPDYVMLCDCNVVYDKWMKGCIEQTKGVKLLSTPYGSPEWIKNWKGDIYFYVNRDCIKTERIFFDIVGDIRSVPAGSNVSNSMLVLFTGSDEYQNTNFSGYNKYLLTGYDYCWRPDGKYYAFTNPLPKKNYMNHRTMRDFNDDIVFTSENLFFSARWFYSYITSYNLQVVNCSERGLLDLPNKDKLENQLKRIDVSKAKEIRFYFEQLKSAFNNFKSIESQFEKTRGLLI